VAETIKGEIPGLAGALKAALNHYMPGDLGVCLLDPHLHVSLPLEGLTWWAWLEEVALSAAAAGSSDPVVMFTVPADERIELMYCFAERNSGDNTVRVFHVTPPADYRSGTDSSDQTLSLITLSTGLVRLYWPDQAATQANLQYMLTFPVLMEPGTTVSLVPGGVGATGSAWVCTLRMRRTKIIRALTPTDA